MTILEQTSGTIVNVITVALGTGLGLILRGRLPDRILAVVMQAIGLTTLVIGIINAFDLTSVTDPPGLILALVALAIGGALGEWWRIEDGLESFGERLKKRFRGKGSFTEGFVTASLLFCVGPLTLVGSIQNGLAGDNSFLLLKSTLDAFSSLALAATFGFGVAFSVVVILLYQGSLSLFAGAFASLVPDPYTDPNVLLVNGTGGIMIIALGLGLLGIKKIRVASMLPSLVLVVVLHQAVSRLW